VNPKEPSKHSTLATQVFKPSEFAAQINFSFANAWGIIKSIVDHCLSLPEGKYLMVKDPNKVK
jgi:translation initiation factor 3 subunit D